jgi:phytoene synthase
VLSAAPPAGPELRGAYRHCARVTRRSGSSFASTFWMLPPPRRRALQAVYAFCRLADDIADDPTVRGDRSLLLRRWREELENAYRGKPTHPVGIALGDAVHRFQLPESVFQELLRGVESDLRAEPIDSFDDLARYCYRVASTVGLLVVRVLGYHNPRSLEYARAMGIAVQLTNVLRDVGEDAASGRIYLAREDLERMGVEPERLARRQMSDELRLVLAVYAERARIHYDRAAALLPREDRWTLRAAEAMGRIYRELLDELQRRGFPCLEGSLRLPRSRRVTIAAAAFLGLGSRP